MRDRKRLGVALGVYPGRVLSEMGRRVLDLNALGMNNSAIARHVGCHAEQIRQLVEDPRRQPRFTTAVLLIRLHEDVQYGIGTWGRMIKALNAHGFSYEQIAARCGTHIVTIKNGLNPTWIPSYSIGLAISKMYETHVGSIEEMV